MKKLCFIIAYIILCVPILGMAQTNYAKSEGKIIVNDVFFSEDGTVLLPLRAVFEHLGGEVSWDADTRNISLSYRGVDLDCSILAPNSAYPEVKYFYATNPQNQEAVLLNPMGFAGGVLQQNGTTYLYQESMGYLLDYFNVVFTVDASNKCCSLDANPEVICGKLICNGKTIDTETVLFWQNGTGLCLQRYPLRAMCEGLGATVTWNEEHRQIEIIYRNRRFLCESYTSGAEYLRIKDVTADRYLVLDASNVTDWRIERIDGRIYLYPRGADSLLSAMGVSQSIDCNKLTVELFCD